MKVELSIGFNSLFTNLWVTIKNPPTIPHEGEVFGCKWEDFIKDDAVVKKLYEFYEEGVWVAHIFSRKYSKKKVVVHITLLEEKHYDEHYGRNLTPCIPKTKHIESKLV